MKIAVVHLGGVVRVEAVNSLEDYPEHKRLALAEDGGKTRRPLVEVGSGPVKVETIAPEQVTWTWSYPAVSSYDIKQECQRRIIGLWGASDLNSCLIKQLNAQARATEIVFKLASAIPLGEIETAEAEALQALRDETKRLRDKSNELELILPEDYTSDTHWNAV